MTLSRATRLLLPAALLLGCVLLGAREGSDTDGDGIPDLFEPFFGLVGDDAGPDADPDTDGLSNFHEKSVWTDPLNPDTDLDGWPDGVDDDPVSRALWFWGEPRLTYGATNVYTRPAWAGNGLAAGGAHVEYPGFSHAWSLEPGDFLLMPVDGPECGDGLWLAVAAAGGGLAADLLGPDLAEVAPPVGLAPAGDVWLTNRLPLAGLPGVRAVSLYVTQGVAHVFASMLYADADGDGYDDAQALQLAGPGSVPGAPAQPSPMTAAVLPAQTNIPLSQAAFAWRLGFEQAEGYPPGPVHGVQGWCASGAAQVVAGQAAEGSQSLLLGRAPGGEGPVSASRRLPPPVSAGAVWVSLKTRMTASGEGPTPVGSAAFALQGEHVTAYDGAARRWVRSGRAFPGITSRWARVDVRLDFDAKTFTLCCDGVATHRDLGFADPSVSGLNALEAWNGAAADAGLDAVAVSDREPDGLDFDGDGLPNALERGFGTDPWSADSDGDGITDAVEAALG